MATQGNFRYFSSTSIDRGIGIDRIGVEKTTFDFFRETYGAQAKTVRAPKTAIMRRFYDANI